MTAKTKMLLSLLKFFIMGLLKYFRVIDPARVIHEAP